MICSCKWVNSSIKVGSPAQIFFPLWFYFQLQFPFAWSVPTYVRINARMINFRDPFYPNSQAHNVECVFKSGYCSSSSRILDGFCRKMPLKITEIVRILQGFSEAIGIKTKTYYFVKYQNTRHNLFWILGRTLNWCSKCHRTAMPVGPEEVES